MSEPPRGRRGRPGHDRAAVLRAAIELFNRRGYDATSIGDVADALGVTKSAVYHHVDSKEALLSEALDEALGELEAVLDAESGGSEPGGSESGGSESGGSESGGSESGGSAAGRLHRVVRRSVEVLVAHQPAVTLLLRVHGNTAVERGALARRRAIDARLAALVRAAAEEGGLRADLDPDLVSRLVFGMVNSLVEWLRPGGPLTADELADAVVALAFEGLGPRCGTAPVIG